MEVKERDPVSGRETTGHEWNGIKELDTPVPRGVLIFLIVTHVWAIAWWFFVPAWPWERLTPRAFSGSTRSRRSRPRLRRPSASGRLDEPHRDRRLRRNPG